MRIKQKHVHWIWLRVRQVHVTQNLKRLRGHLPRIRCQAVRDLQAILIRLMFEVPAEGAENGACEEEKNRQEKQQRGQRRPIVHAPNSPVRAPVGKHPANQAEPEIEERKQERSEEHTSE